MSDRLKYLTEQLKSLSGPNADPESGHARADALLIEALREVWNQDVFASYQIDALLAAYAAVPKWYA